MAYRHNTIDSLRLPDVPQKRVLAQEDRQEFERQRRQDLLTVFPSFLLYFPEYLPTWKRVPAFVCSDDAGKLTRFWNARRQVEQVCAVPVGLDMQQLDQLRFPRRMKTIGDFEALVDATAEANASQVVLFALPMVFVGGCYLVRPG